jgi:hypothetical protein
MFPLRKYFIKFEIIANSKFARKNLKYEKEAIVNFAETPGSIVYSPQEIYHFAGRHIDKDYQNKVLYKVS